MFKIKTLTNHYRCDRILPYDISNKLGFTIKINQSISQSIRPMHKCNAVPFMGFVLVCNNASQHPENNCGWMLHLRRWWTLENADDSVLKSYVWQPAETHGTWRRRWKGWYSRWSSPVPRWSGRTSLRSRQRSRDNWERTGFRLVSSRW